MSFHLGKPRLPSVEYYPNNIGNLSIGTPRTYAFLIYGRDEKAIQVQILSGLLKRGARILSQTGYVDDKSREFTLCVSCDLGEASVTPDDLVIELRRIKQVRNAMAICLKNRMFDGFLFPLTILLTNRVVSIDSNIMFHIQERMSSEDSNIVLRDVGRDYALDIVKQVRNKMPAGFSEDAIQENVRGYLKASGWGSFTWNSETTFEKVVVIDPPIYSGKAVGDSFLHGMAAGLVESFKKKKFMLAEEVYNQDTRSLTLMLAELRVEVKRLESPSEKKITKSVEVKALEEVEKVIRSVELDEMEIENSPVARDEPKPVLLVQQSGVEEKRLEPLKEVVPVMPIEVPQKVTAPRIETPVPNQVKSDVVVEKPKQEIIREEVLQKDVQPAKEKIEPVEEEPRPEIARTIEGESPKEEPPKEVVPPIVEDKKPLIIQIKGIRENDEDEDDDVDSNELWFEQAVQE